LTNPLSLCLGTSLALATCLLRSSPESICDEHARDVIWGGRIMGANMRAKEARERAQEAVREADRAEAEAWSVRMEGYGGPAVPYDRPAYQRRLGLAGG